MPRFLLLFILALLITTVPVFAAEDASPALTRAQAAEALKEIQGEVLSVSPTEIPNLYRVAMKMQGQVVPLYLDASASYLFSGNLIRLSDRTNLTDASFRTLNPVNTADIPLEDALLLGDADAAQMVIVFTDPHCPYCSKLHQVLKEAVANDPDLAFQIKLLPLKDSSREISRTIICNRSLDQLEKVFRGESIARTECSTDAIDQNLQLGQQLGIRGTPTLVLPNGQLAPGYRPLDELIDLIGNNRS